VTSPVQTIRVVGPSCGREYEDWTRGSVNLDLDDFDDDYVRRASTATCPSCGFVVELDALVVKDGVWRFPRSGDVGADDVSGKMAQEGGRVVRSNAQHDLSERAKAWVERTCAEQGVPVKLSDPIALRRIAAILGEARDPREKALVGAGRRRDRRLGQRHSHSPLT
jgi:hypothetical protein